MIFLSKCVATSTFLLHLTVVHVYGSPYDMGYAQGSLLKAAISEILPAFYKHVESEVEQYLHDLPKEMQDFIAEVGLNAALDITHLLTEKYTATHFYEELHGLADASGVDYDLLLRIHMLPELVKVLLQFYSYSLDSEAFVLPSTLSLKYNRL